MRIFLVLAVLGLSNLSMGAVKKTDLQKMVAQIAPPIRYSSLQPGLTGQQLKKIYGNNLEKKEDALLYRKKGQMVIWKLNDKDQVRSALINLRTRVAKQGKVERKIIKSAKIKLSQINHLGLAQVHLGSGATADIQVLSSGGRYIRYIKLHNKYWAKKKGKRK